jgi:hypothetical protein
MLNWSASSRAASASTPRSGSGGEGALSRIHRRVLIRLERRTFPGKGGVRNNYHGRSASSWLEPFDRTGQSGIKMQRPAPHYRIRLAAGESTRCWT